MPFWEEIALWSTIIGVSIILLFSLIMLRVQISRYEKFRAEAAELFSSIADSLGDLNQRLTAAGYPPGRIVPASTYPNAAASGLVMSQQPGPSMPQPSRIIGR